MNLLIIGAPGAGKGTMSDYLIDDLKVKHVSTGDMLRQAIKDGTKTGLEAKTYMDKGELVPDEVINGIITDFLTNTKMPNGFLFDGYPRTVAQAEALSKILASINSKIDAVINLNIADEILIKRTEGRRLCPKCGANFNVYFKPPIKEGVCDNCGSELYTRSDDNAESLKIRLSEFHKNTQPVVDYYKKFNLVKDIDATKLPKEVYASIKQTLEGIQ